MLSVVPDASVIPQTASLYRYSVKELVMNNNILFIVPFLWVGILSLVWCLVLVVRLDRFSVEVASYDRSLLLMLLMIGCTGLNNVLVAS